MWRTMDPHCFSQLKSHPTQSFSILPQSHADSQPFQSSPLNSPLILQNFKGFLKDSEGFPGRAATPHPHDTEMNIPEECRIRPPTRCPEGNRAQRTHPIIPVHKSYPINITTDFRSTYRNDFVPIKADRSLYHGPPRKPWRSEGVFEVDSVYRTEFRPFPAYPKEKLPWVTKHEYNPPNRPMNVQSSYNRDYPLKKGIPAKTTKRPTFLDPNPPLIDDSSTYKTQFLAWCLPTKEMKKTKEEIIEETNVGRVPFDGITTYKRDYILPKGCVSRKPLLLKTPVYPKGKFDDRTIYRMAYEPYFYDDVEGLDLSNCLQPDVYDNIYPKEDKCADCYCFPEADRPDPSGLAPAPPCPYPAQPGSCPSSQEFRCAPRTIPCISPYKMKHSRDDYGVHEITLTKNTQGDLRAGPPAIIDCPSKEFY